MSCTAPITQAIQSRLRGTVVGADDDGFEQLRRVWNGRSIAGPAPSRAAPMRATFSSPCKSHAITRVGVTVRGGGHNVAGLAVRDGALLLDLGAMRAVSVNRRVRIATVEGGALWRDVDAATAAAGLATTGGMISTTGVGGFTLGGGAGWLMRRVRPRLRQPARRARRARRRTQRARRRRRASRSLLGLAWRRRRPRRGHAASSSGLYPLAQVLAGLVVFPARPVGGGAAPLPRDFALEAPDEFCGMAVLDECTAAALPRHGMARPDGVHPGAVLVRCGRGRRTHPRAAPPPGAPLADVVAPMPYAQWQQMLDPSAPPWTLPLLEERQLRELERRSIDLLAAAADTRRTPFTRAARAAHGRRGRTRAAVRLRVRASRRPVLRQPDRCGARSDGLRRPAWMDPRPVHEAVVARAARQDAEFLRPPTIRTRSRASAGHHARRLQDLRRALRPDGLFASTRHADDSRPGRDLRYRRAAAPRLVDDELVACRRSHS